MRAMPCTFKKHWNRNHLSMQNKGLGTLKRNSFLLVRPANQLECKWKEWQQQSYFYTPRCSQAFCWNNVACSFNWYQVQEPKLSSWSKLWKTFTDKPQGDQHFRSVVEYVPLEFRNKVIETYYNLRTTQQHYQQRTLASHLAMNTFTTVQAPSWPSLLQSTTHRTVSWPVCCPFSIGTYISTPVSDPSRR